MQIDELIIEGSLPAIDAMRRLEETGRRILFIAPEGKLSAVLTDSDIRKFILRGGDLSAPVEQAANHHPKSLPVEKRGDAQAFMNRNIIDAVPLLDKSGVMVDVVFSSDLGALQGKKLLSSPVVIMAGGLGTRLYPYTKILPKPLIPVGEVPIIERVMEKFATFGCDAFTVIVNYRKNMIKSYFADLEGEKYNVAFVDEEEPLGTGGGLSLLKGHIFEPFFLTNCDVLVNADYADIADFHARQQNAVTMVCATKQFTIPYGVVQLGEDGHYAGISEKPQMNFLTNTGMYLVQPEVLEGIPDGVKQGFPDIIEACRAAGGRIGVYPISDDAWMDMGQIEELEAMRRRLEQ